jgi:hypothetical protein
MDRTVPFIVFLITSIATISLTSLFIVKTRAAIPLQYAVTKKLILPPHFHALDPFHLIHITQKEKKNIKDQKVITIRQSIGIRFSMLNYKI